MRGKLRHDFDVSFSKSVNALFKGSYSPEERNQLVEEMTEGYFAKTGEYPSGKLLEKLTDFILDDDLRDSAVDKITKTEYPILSDKQIARRVFGRHLRSKFAKTEVELIEAEVNYHANEMLSVFLVYKPPGKQFKKKVIRFKDIAAHFERKTTKYRSRSDGDAAWSKAVRERDDYMCQNPKCSSRVGIMHAHHIESYVDNPEVRTELSNGITLCVDCHNEFHSIYGKGGNTRTQLDEYFETSLAI